MNTIHFTYLFTRTSGETITVGLEITRDTGELIFPANTSPPPTWTRLDLHRCPNCPDSLNNREFCPAALALLPVMRSFSAVISHEELAVEVISNERRISQTTTAQRAIGSLIGLLFASSGCPNTAYFRPMARYHLPFASEEETVWRAVATYLMAQYFRRKQGLSWELELSGLSEIYADIQLINQALAARLRAASKTDSSINAVILLDMYAKAIPFLIEENLADIREIFKPFLE